MSVRRFLFLAFTGAALSAGPGAAQSLRNLPVPAEFPPASFTGAQYVDSNGCVFIRAGVNAGETWVPRLSRARQPLCGFEPSLPGSAPETVAEAPAAAPAQQTQRTAAASQPKPAPEPASAPRAATARDAERTAAADSPRPAQSAPERVVIIKVAEPKAEPEPEPEPRKQPAAKPAGTVTHPDPSRTACAGLTGVSAAYTVQHNGSPVRCGPQKAHYVTYARSSTTVATTPPPGTRATPASVPRGTRVAPAHVHASQKTSLAGIRVPEGMKPVWEDDRLNPRRAHQTFEGKARMDLMWTNTVPRRLIDRRTGAEVIHNFPGLQPPFTSFEEQRAAGVTVATRGVYVPDPVTASEARRHAQAAAPRASVSTRSVSTRSVSTRSVSTRPVSTRPEPAATETPRPAPRRTVHYAQAGIFADAEQGRAAAQRVAKSGLPARQGKLDRDGRRLTVVLAGPFASETDARDGAVRLRGMGFTDVRLR